MPTNLKKEFNHNIGLDFSFDIESFQDRFAEYTSTSFLRTYSHYRPFTQVDVVNKLVSFTLKYFQNDKNVIANFLTAITECQYLAANQELIPLYRHQNIEALIDGLDNFSQYQDLIDHIEKVQDILTSSLKDERYLKYSMRVRNAFNQIKTFYPFIENLISQYSQLENEIKKHVNMNFFCFIMRPDRIRAGFKITLSGYMRNLEKIIS